MNTLPSHFQINDSVQADFMQAGTISSATVIRVHFSESKVHYDLEISLGNDMYTRIYNVDSALVKEPA